VAEVWLSRRAYADLAEIDRFGAEQFGEAAAEAYQEAFDRAFERLAAYPHSGEAKPEYGPGLRSLVCGRHRILYRIEEKIVQIVCVLHHSQDVARHLPQ
jgi:toxin ParE1/3/4